MSIALDGFEVLRQVGKNAEVFALIRADVDKQARALVIKFLKMKSVGLDTIRDIRKALGKEQFGLVIESLKDSEVKSVLTRVDKHHPNMKEGTTGWRRQHLNALSDGSSTPHPLPEKAKKASRRKIKAEPPRLRSEVIDLYRDGSKKKP